MDHIIAGRFEIQGNAERAREVLQDDGFPIEDSALFYVNPHGQHSHFPIGGDESVSPGARESGKGALAGGGIGAVAGAAIGSVAGPVGAAIGGGVGAYTGSLAGAMTKTDMETEAGDEAEEEPAKEPLIDRRSGLHLAVKVNGAEQGRAVEILRACGAAELEIAEGEITDGEWVDFDPTKAVRLLPERDQAS